MSAGGGRSTVTLLGATGVVGQRLIRRLAGHPELELVALGASPRSAGLRYREAVRWLLPEPIPEAVAELRVFAVDELVERSGTDLYLSALDPESARRFERRLVERGRTVVTNASVHRMDDDVPLVVPEVNPGHLELGLRRPPGSGRLIANPNCAAIGLALVAKPLADAFGLERIQVTTLQAASGAGHPGVPALDLLGNVLPGIAGEEEKLESEPTKILGRLLPGGVERAPIAISAQTHRVPIVDGHLLALSFGFSRRASADEVRGALEGFRAPEAIRCLPSAPPRPIELAPGEHSPQPRLDLLRGGGMTVTVGRVRRCPVQDVRLVALVHNAERGAAGGTILLAELVRRSQPCSASAGASG